MILFLNKAKSSLDNIKIEIGRLSIRKTILNALPEKNLESVVGGLDIIKEVREQDKIKINIGVMFSEEFGYGLGFDTTIVFDPSNNEMKAISMPNNQTYPLYNEPGKLKYGNKKFVPTYEESVLLSSETNKNLSKSPKNSSSNYKPFVNEIKMGKYEND